MKVRWLVEFEEEPLPGVIDSAEDAIESSDELLSFINVWIADDPQRAKWLKAISAVKLES